MMFIYAVCPTTSGGENMLAANRPGSDRAATKQ